MSKTIKHELRLKSAKAVSFIEAIFTIPLLLIICVCTIEASQYIRLNIQASQLAYEGARLAASRSGLVNDITLANPQVTDAANSAIKARLAELARRQNMYVVQPDRIDIEYVKTNPPNSVRVQVRVPYTPLIKIWGKEEIISTTYVPYLYPEIL